MEIEIHSLSAKELVELYHRTNAGIRKQLIDGRSWTELKDTIALLTELSKEISKRKLPFNDRDTTPADTPFR
jgi:hypothetical protein